jgi:protein-S-isoprenylcysteine O-methyltransferase Ste14
MATDFFNRGGTWVVCQFILLGLVFFFSLAGKGPWSNAQASFLGSALFVLGVFCGIAGTMALGRGLTPFPRPSTRALLVQNGIYRFVRHPLYLAVFLGSVGWALVWDSVPALVAALMLMPFFDAKARREEQWLRQQFPEYPAYEKRVKRFLPWIY